MAKVTFTKNMLMRGDILINRNGDVKEWRMGDGINGRLYELKSRTLGRGRGYADDHLGHELNSDLKSSNGFKCYDIVKVIRQGMETSINT